MEPLSRQVAEQGREPTATLDLGTNPLGVVKLGLPGIAAVVPCGDRPDGVLLLAAGQVHEEHAVELFGTSEFRRVVSANT